MGRWLVVNPPYLGSALFVRKKNINISAHYLEAVLAAIGVDAELYNAACAHRTPAEAARAISQSGTPEAIVFPIIDGGALLNAMAITEELRSRGARPLTILCGHGATVAHQEILCQFHRLVDLIVVGEEEQTVADMALRVMRNEPWEGIAGIAYVRDGRLFVTASRAQLYDLDALPVLGSNYHHNYAVVLSSRGCTGACSFCNVNYYFDPQSGRSSWRGRSPKHVMQELRLLAEQGVKFVEFADANFLGDSGGVARAHELQRLLAAAHLDLRFMINARADALQQHRSLIASLQEVGLRRVEVGFEAYNDAHLKWLNKETDRRDNDLVLDLLSALSLDVQVEFIMFTPLTTMSDVRENLAFLKRVGALGFSIRKALFNILRLENGSLLTEAYRAQGKLRKGRLFAYDYDFEDRQVKEFYDLLAGSYPRSGIREYHQMAVAKALVDGIADGDPAIEEYRVLASKSEQTVLKYFETVLEAVTGGEEKFDATEPLFRMFSEAEERIVAFNQRRFPEMTALLQ